MACLQGWPVVGQHPSSPLGTQVIARWLCMLSLGCLVGCQAVRGARGREEQALPEVAPTATAYQPPPLPTAGFGRERPVPQGKVQPASAIQEERQTTAQAPPTGPLPQRSSIDIPSPQFAAGATTLISLGQDTGKSEPSERLPLLLNTQNPVNAASTVSFRRNDSDTPPSSTTEQSPVLANLGRAACQNLTPIAANTASFRKQEGASPPAGPSIEHLPVLAPNDSANQLTLPQLEQMALQGNPSLAEAAARLAARRGRWVQVGLYPNTVLGYSGQQLASAGRAEQQGLYVEQEFVRGKKLQLNRDVAEAEIRKAERQWAAQEQRVLTDVRLGYYEVLIAQARIDVTDRLVNIGQEALRAADALLRAQEVSRVDVVRARAELQMAQMQARNARSTHSAAWQRLVAVLGAPDLPPQPVAGKLEHGTLQVDPLEAQQRLLAQSPELQAALAEVMRTRRAIARAEAEPVPNVNVQAIVQHDNSINSTDGALLLTMPIPWLNYNQGGIPEARSTFVAAQRSADRLALSLQRRFATVFRQYEIAHTQVDAYAADEGILKNSNEALELIRQSYQAGQVAYLDLLTAQRIYSQTNLDYVESLGQLWAAYVEIEGLLLKDSLNAVR